MRNNNGNKNIQVERSRKIFIRKMLYFDFEDKKICKICNITKQNKDFYHTIAKRSSGHRNFRIRKECIECIKTRMKESFYKNYHHNLKRIRIAYREKHRFKYIKNQYGINKEEYLTLVKNYPKCLICNKLINNPQIDHCHKTGVVRGILCFRCNLGLGNFDDNINKLKRAISYLERSKKNDFKSETAGRN